MPKVIARVERQKIADRGVHQKVSRERTFKRELKREIRRRRKQGGNGADG